MQVSHSSELAKTAVASANKSKVMELTNAAEFFHVFSTALYKDPLYAFVREVICNAWDAHIEAGKQDTPIKITLTDDYIEITDSGLGIPHDKMHDIYCVYGDSTKRQDSRTTGGMGLGCKSPFSYAESFQVTSHNNGTKVIYRLLRSDVEHGGKPSCLPIVEVPTTETGLSVRVPVEEHRICRVRKIIKEVVNLGSIKATLNDEELETRDMSTEAGSY